MVYAVGSVHLDFGMLLGNQSSVYAMKLDESFTGQIRMEFD
jgi:hypothetical protein